MNTIKTLCLIRHANALPEHPQGDFYRSLSPRGQQEAQALGLWLKNQEIPDIVFLSPAQRTEETAALLRQAVHFSEAAIVRAENFYQASAAIWLNSLRQLAEKQQTAWIIGHNPGLEELAMAWHKESGGMATAEARVFSLTNWQSSGKFIKRYQPML